MAQGFDRTGRADPQDLCSRVCQRGTDEPERLFARVLSGGRVQTITYGEFVAAASRYAADYLDRGVQPGDVVLIILRHGPELFYSFMGALLVGALPSFLPFLTPKQNPALYWASHQALFARIDARLLVTWRENLASINASIPGFAVPVHLVEQTRRAGEIRSLPERQWRGPAFLQHSSGTTGLKKGVIITHEALRAQVEAYAGAIGLDEKDTIATWLPLYHDMGLIACFLMPAMLGVPIVCMDPFEWVLKPTMLLDAVEEYGCTLAWLPNFAFHHLLALAPEDRRWDLSSVRAFIDCSEPCRTPTFRLFAERFADMGLGPDKLQTCYALAEYVFAATQSCLGEPVPMVSADARLLQAEGRIEPAATRPEGVTFLSCGTPLEGVGVRILDPDGGELIEGLVGEIALSGASLFDGYFRNPEESAARLSCGWYRTRDLGFQHHGALYVTGRLDDLLIVHGVNYYAHDIEFAVHQLPDLVPGRCVAIGEFQPGAGTTEVIVLAEVEQPDQRREVEIKRTIKSRILSEVGLVVEQVGIVPRGWLVKTTSGKISRAENLKRFREGRTPEREPT